MRDTYLWSDNDQPDFEEVTDTTINVSLMMPLEPMQIHRATIQEGHDFEKTYSRQVAGPRTRTASLLTHMTLTATIRGIVTTEVLHDFYLSVCPTPNFLKV